MSTGICIYMTLLAFFAIGLAIAGDLVTNGGYPDEDIG